MASSTKDEPDSLDHYGVPGMKWGVRKARSGQISARATVNRRARKDQVWVLTAKQLSYGKIYKKASGKIRKGTRLLNKSDAYKDQDFRQDSPLRQKYYSEYSKMVTDQLNAAATLSRKGSSPNKKYELHFTFDMAKDSRPVAHIRMKDPKRDQKLSRQNAKETRRLNHADEIDLDEYSSETLDVELIYNEKGFIVDIKVPQVDDLDHAISDEALEDFFEHYGVLGMKWGVRRDRSSGSSEGSSKGGTVSKSSSDKKPATIKPSGGVANSAPKPKSATSTIEKPSSNPKKMTDQELQAAINRLNMEKQYKQLTSAPVVKTAQNNSRVKKLILDVGHDSIKQAGTKFLTKMILKGLEAGVSKATGTKIKLDTGGKKNKGL